MLVQMGFDVLETVRATPFRFPLYVRVPLAMRIEVLPENDAS